MQKASLKFYVLLGFITYGVLLSFNNALAQDFKQKKQGPINTGAVIPPAKEVNEAAFVEGMKYYIIEEYQKALEIFLKTEKDDSNNAGLLFQISSTYQKLKKSDNAIVYALKAYEIDKNNYDYGLMAAGLLAKNGEFEKAGKIYKLLFERDQSNTEIGLDLAATYFAQTKFDEVLKVYQIIENNLGVNKELSQQKQSLYLKLGKINDAIKEGEKLIESDPNEIEYYVDLAELLIRNDKIEDGKKYIEKALKISPEHGQAHVLLADIYRRKSDWNNMLSELSIACDDRNLDGYNMTKILVSFLEVLPPEVDRIKKENLVKKIIQNDPNEPRGYLLMGDILLQAGDKKEANANYIKAVGLDKSTNQIWMRILALDNEQQLFKDLVKHSEAAIELYPNQAIFWYYNGSGNFMLNQFKEATESLEEAKRLALDEKELKVIVNVLLGEAYNRLGQHTRSDEAFEIVLQLDPKNDAAANNYSYYLALRKEKLTYATEIAEKLAERNPNNGTYLDTYGWVLYMDKQYEKAKTFLEKAYTSNGGKSAVITEHYGDALFQTGEKDKAVELWKMALKISKNINLEKKISEGKIIE
jgi:tetratricopeptide (TPR) repeat protein